MFTDVRSVSGEILELLERCQGAMSIREISNLSSAGLDMINRGVGELVRRGQVSVQTRDNENFVVRIF